MALHAVILAGGGGTRLWPLSRSQYPKQFLQLIGEHTLLQQTVLRCRGLFPPERTWIVTTNEQEFVVREQLCALPVLRNGVPHVLAEPNGRNTAAAIGFAAVELSRRDPSAIMAVMPADHWIQDGGAFNGLLATTSAVAQAGLLVTMGIVPYYPETGYGYIRRGERLVPLPGASDAAGEAYSVERFVEKPDRSTADEYLASGAYYWNAGIFCWQASTILGEIALHAPALSRGLEIIDSGLDSKERNTAMAAVYKSLEPLSIDYAVLEKSSRLAVVPADIGWSDLGDWTTIHRLSPRDERGNTLGCNVLDLDSEDSFVYGDRRMITTIGLKNTIVIDTADALLICSHGRAQEVKQVVQQLASRSTELVNVHRTVGRPWGRYTVLEEGPGFKVKRIFVKPGAALSLQLHYHRNEHWVVTAGVADVINGATEFRLGPNESTYIPKQTRHRVANTGNDTLEFIEVQMGSYLGEDDIVRFSDLYDRV